MPIKKLTLGAMVCLAAVALGLGGCTGEVAEDGDHDVTEVDSTSAALSSSPQPATGEAGDQESADKECDSKDGDHHKHRRHKFKALDRLDGAEDGAITLASLPAGLPDRLSAKLHKIDTDQDGIVTKAEAKAWMHHKRRGPKAH